MSTCTEDFVTAGTIAGAGGTLTAIGKHYTSDKILDKAEKQYNRQLKIASAFEERYKPRVRFHYTMKDIEQDIRGYVEENRLRNGKEWTTNAYHNLENFINNKKMTDEQIIKRLQKAVTLDNCGLPNIKAASTFEELWLTPKPDELFGGMDKYFKRLKAEYIPGRIKMDKDVSFLNKLRQKPFLLSANPKLKLITNLVMGATVLGTTYFTVRGLSKLFGRNLNVDNNPTPTIMKTEPQVQSLPKAVEQPAKHKELKAKFEEGFKELGIPENIELKEYTPKRGEYWISILKAKYGVDDVTAQKMANKIKDMVYDDPKAPKQTPVMYLPQTWTFEGKTYQYNENAAVITTDNYSDDVKTEMGKMSKDLKY